MMLFVTTRSKAEALTIGRALVEEKLASCINVWEGVESVYWWKDKIEEASEGILLVKTSPECKTAAVERIKALHSYESPCIIELPSETL